MVDRRDLPRPSLAAAATQSAEPLITPTVTPKRFGNYEIECELGRGGMGIVFRAKQLALNRTVALKHHGQRKSEKTVKRTLRREGSTRPSLAGGARADNAADGACVARTRATFSIRPGN